MLEDSSGWQIPIVLGSGISSAWELLPGGEGGVDDCDPSVPSSGLSSD